MKILGVVTVLVALAQPSGAADPDVVGTYEIQICRPACASGNPTNLLVRGLLVLESKEFSPNEIPEPERKLFQYGYGYDALPNGCFVLETIQPERSYAGIDAIGLTRWVVTPEGVRLELYSSSDAGYRAKVQVSEAGFTGQGISWGAGAAAPSWGPEFVTGRRIGLPDRSRCIEAATKARH